jgi:hypothetical protein
MHMNTLLRSTVGADLSCPPPISAFHKIPRPPVGADCAMEQTTPDSCRGRLIVPTAALSAPLEFPLSR